VIDLTQFPRPARWAIRALWALGGIGLAMYAAGAAGGYERPLPDAAAVLYVCLFLVAATLCILRAALVREERVTWAAFGISTIFLAASHGYRLLVETGLESPTTFSPGDALRLGFYAFAIAGLLAAMHARIKNFRPSMCVDGAIGALAIAAVVAAVLLQPILDVAGSSAAATVTNIAYPLIHVAIISLVLGVLALSDWRAGRAWLIVAIAFTVQGSAASIYLYHAATGTYAGETLLHAMLPACALVVALAAWQRPSSIHQAQQTHGWQTPAVISAFALVGLGLLTYEHWHRINDIAVILAVLTLVTAFVRTATTLSDVRSLVRSRELLERNELILHAAGDGIVGVDDGGTITFANPAAAAMVGYDPAELVGRNLHATLHHSRPDGSPYPFEECPVWASLRAGTVHHVDEDTYWRRDGSSFASEFTVTPVLRQEHVTRAVVVFKEITERKAAAAALAASDLRTRQILETAHDAFVGMDAAGLIVDWNPQAETTFGWSREEAQGRQLADTIIPERFREAHRHALQRLLATGKATILNQHLELPALHRDGHEFPVELTISALQAEGYVTFNAFARDISERKAAEELLERQRQQLVEAQSVGGFGSWDWDIAADAVAWSDELFRIYGIEPTDHPRTKEEALRPTHPDDRQRLEGHVQACLQTGEPIDLERRIVQPDGTVVMTHTRGQVVADEQGAPARIIGTVQDITERHAAQRAKDEFTSVVSHELRTPLTSIRGSLGLLESGVLGPLPEQGQRMVQIAVANTDRLVRLINDILDIERIESGQIDMHPASCDAGELIQQAIEAVASVAAEAQVTVTAGAEPLPLYADADRVIQTLTNLISNAIKFSPPGSRVHVSCTHHDGEVLFQVEDQGRGIPAENLESIFERFQQVNASDSRDKGGTGLGLAICRSIVEQHDGRIWAQSTPGQGSTFSFVLPASAPREDTPHVSANPDGPTVLVCDDDPCVTEMVAAMLKQHGYRVVAVPSGEQALEHAIAEPPDAILLDLLMPGVSGWETAAALSANAETQDIPIVILSVLPEAETAAPEGAVVDWVQKPLDDVQLFAALEHAVTGREEPFKVLIVEDDADLGSMLTATFRSHGAQTHHAHDGAEAIALSDSILPDLLVLDLDLPDVDGFEVVAWLRRHERLCSVPMVIYTARDLDDRDRRRLRLRLDAGTQFLTKGRITPHDFEHRVMAILKQMTQPDRQKVST